MRDAGCSYCEHLFLVAISKCPLVGHHAHCRIAGLGTRGTGRAGSQRGFGQVDTTTSFASVGYGVLVPTRERRPRSMTRSHMLVGAVWHHGRYADRGLQILRSSTRVGWKFSRGRRTFCAAAYAVAASANRSSAWRLRERRTSTRIAGGRLRLARGDVPGHCASRLQQGIHPVCRRRRVRRAVDRRCSTRTLTCSTRQRARGSIPAACSSSRYPLMPSAIPRPLPGTGHPVRPTTTHGPC